MHAGSQQVEVNLNVFACWQSSTYNGGVMLVCLETCKLLIEVERAHSGEHKILTATARVVGGPAGVRAIFCLVLFSSC